MASTYGVSAYQQTTGTWNTNKATSKSETSSATATSSTNSATASKSQGVRVTDVKTIDSGSALIPTQREGVGLAIGNVELSDGAQKYYEKLKAKFHNMEFIAVSKDMKSQVQANAAAYGNAKKQVVLIDDEKIEKMATDESFRKKYEGIIAMSQAQLEAAKNSLTSTGANVKNFGMSVDSNGKTSFFATVEKSAEKKAAEKKVAAKKETAKKEAKLKEKKAAEKKAAEKAADKKIAEKKAEEKAAEKKAKEAAEEASNEPIDDKDYVEIDAPTMESLVNQVSKYAYDNSERNVMTDGEKNVGQNFDFRG